MTPNEIALKIVSKWNDNKLPMSLGAAIAAAIRAERERAEKAEAKLLTVLQREAATTERNDARLDRLEAERDEWRAVAEKDRGTLQPLLSKLAEVQAERDRLRDALTPSAETKAAYMGEFKFPITETVEDDDGDPVEQVRQIPVPWDTVKEIMKAIRGRAALRKTDVSPLGGSTVNEQST